MPTFTNVTPGAVLPTPSAARLPSGSAVPSDATTGGVGRSGSFRWGIPGSTYSYDIGAVVETNDPELMSGLLGTGMFTET